MLILDFNYFYFYKCFIKFYLCGAKLKNLTRCQKTKL